jgi:hypothetical protein
MTSDDKKKERDRDLFPVLKTERGQKDVTDPQDKKDFDLIERSHIYDSYKKEIIAVKDASIVVLYVTLFLIIFISLWLNLETCRFPFNIKILSNISYSRKHWGTPVFAMFSVFVLTIVIYFVRGKMLQKGTTTLIDSVEKTMKKHGAIVDTKTV